MKRGIQNLLDEQISQEQVQPIKEIQIKYKQNHFNLPLLIMPDHRIVVFTNLPLYKKIFHHLKSISEPIFRPKVIHEYKITKFSLYTAMVLHYTGQQICQILKRISKNLVFPETLESQIKQYMRHAGEVIFSLIEGSYYVFATQQIGLIISKFVEKLEEVTIKDIYEYHLDQLSQQLIFEESKRVSAANQLEKIEQNNQQQFFEEQTIKKRDKNFEHLDNAKTKDKILIKYKIIGQYFDVTKLLIERNIPIVQEFDFLNSKQIDSIDIQMNVDVKLRFYQQAALKNVFINGKARSGLIILPCGAGKSMVAIQIIQRIKKRAVIFCQNQTSAIQWRQQFIKWTTVQRGKILVLTSKSKQNNILAIDNCHILITTYSMVGLKRQRQNRYLQRSQLNAWGVCIADQVHKLPAQTFQMVLQKYKFYLKIGLTATPYRQDNKIDNLFYMIGPKLFEQNWLDLVNQGCLAKPYCVQILCHMTPIFADSYLKLKNAELIHTSNPEKFKVLQYLIKKHTYFGDKILVFCDRPKVLQRYAKLLKKPFIHGSVSEEQRLHFYNAFKTIKQFNVLFLSRVGDTAIDLPCANVGIQLGMHYKSRRQEVQRMGRIMRPKDNPFNQYNAFFYTLVSLNTEEVKYSRLRQKILIDQGFQHEIKMSNELNYKGMNMINLDQKEHLLFILSEHQQGDIILNSNRFQTKIGTKIIQKPFYQQENQYYYQQDD